MLTAAQINDIAEKYGLRVSNRWSQTSTGRELPKLEHMWVYFPRPEPEAWALLASSATEVPVSIQGTRNQPHDGLDPCYVALLPAVNVLRAQAGRKPVTP